MKQENKCREILLKVFSIAFSVLFLIITINIIFFNKTIQIDFSTIVMLIGTACVYITLYIVYKITNKYLKILQIKDTYKMLIGIVIFIIQLIIAGLVYAHCGWDCGGVIDNAFSLYQGGEINKFYFSMYPNNIALLLLFKYLYVIVRIIY